MFLRNFERLNGLVILFNVSERAEDVAEFDPVTSVFVASSKPFVIRVLTIVWRLHLVKVELGMVLENYELVVGWNAGQSYCEAEHVAISTFKVVVRHYPRVTQRVVTLVVDSLHCDQLVHCHNAKRRLKALFSQPFRRWKSE